ncbi:Transcriptional activator ptaB [Penicillium malachiteum]|uniref:Transcriptional activator ptaB n=1 Tax=Penicillium malachiteum TaxID=1324776 RepID=UPI00254712FA|nr:Transcriptional activator ptaB [Penicillium malachiteum]KAJ5720464.1 Transcriptional activator ptaB [Penicillium malachiteum]
MHETQAGTPQSQHGPPQGGTPQPSQSSQPPSTHPPQSQGAPSQATPNPQPQQLPPQQQPGQQPGQPGQQQQQQQGPQSQQTTPQNPQALAAQREQQMKVQQNAILLQRMNRQYNSPALILNSYAEHLSAFQSRGEALDLAYWTAFVDRFFSPMGVLRQGIWNSQTGSKIFEISTPALARYYLTQFTSGIRHIQMIVEGATECEGVNGGHVVDSGRTSFIYWYTNESQVFTHGTLRASFDMNNKIELLNISVQSHNEYIPRSVLQQSLDTMEQKQSPKLAKSAAKRAQKQTQSIVLPESMVTSNGVPGAVIQFLEVAETMSQMQLLFNFSSQNPHLPANDALRGLVSNFHQTPPNPNQTFQNPMAAGMQAMGRNPTMGPPSQFASPAMAHLGLPGGQGSPHLTGSAHASPAQSQLSGPPGMQVQPSPAGVNNSPNVGGNKRRRASTVKQENDESQGEVNGNAPGSGKVKASPRVPKRQKGAAS